MTSSVKIGVLLVAVSVVALVDMTSGVAIDAAVSRRGGGPRCRYHRLKLRFFQRVNDFTALTNPRMYKYRIDWVYPARDTRLDRTSNRFLLQESATTFENYDRTFMNSGRWDVYISIYEEILNSGEGARMVNQYGSRTGKGAE
eukprot:CAMPEP_0198733784 /NCGR_PEP_ID=MMETSP1475-20131203/48234_1 /TAXON_ID= ORGANISM="Unidentified sp., Strain CCMP1999" /NCGR_SAMPLE_ID=MMETSP1475 /ASSEMBLY_ACC=CAM_ASM_001111 /LENGTH=142 /DNA_ID=CAMNT_0044497137 /DNA_START=106 /DNA_END=535 /DNA_ORIENTATION=+